jgi:hypothetical protein
MTMSAYGSSSLCRHAMSSFLRLRSCHGFQETIFVGADAFGKVLCHIRTSPRRGRQSSDHRCLLLRGAVTVNTSIATMCRGIQTAVLLVAAEAGWGVGRCRRSRGRVSGWKSLAQGHFRVNGYSISRRLRTSTVEPARQDWTAAATALRRASQARRSRRQELAVSLEKQGLGPSDPMGRLEDARKMRFLCQGSTRTLRALRSAIAR